MGLRNIEASLYDVCSDNTLEMALSRATIFVLVLALLAIPFGVLELAFGHNFSSFFWRKRWTENIHIVWCWFANSRFAFVFGAALFVLSPLWFLVVSIFSFLLLVCEIVLDFRIPERHVFTDYVQKRHASLQADKRARRRGSYFSKPEFTTGHTLAERLVASEDDPAREIVYEAYEAPEAPGNLARQD